MTLKDACARRKVDLDQLLAALAEVDAETASDEVDWTERSLSDLTLYLVECHHAYLRESMPRLQVLANKVARVHGDVHPELLEVAQVYGRFHSEMDLHLDKEEQVLFPAIRNLEAGVEGGFPVGFIAQPIRMMEMEHDQAGADLEALRKLTDGFVPPEGACNSYRALFQGLQELEIDTHAHIHKENNILHPRTLALLG